MECRMERINASEVNKPEKFAFSDRTLTVSVEWSKEVHQFYTHLFCSPPHKAQNLHTNRSVHQVQDTEIQHDNKTSNK